MLSSGRTHLRDLVGELLEEEVRKAGDARLGVLQAPCDACDLALHLRQAIVTSMSALGR